jgi:hypothetical protein
MTLHDLAKSASTNILRKSTSFVSPSNSYSHQFTFRNGSSREYAAEKMKENLQLKGPAMFNVTILLVSEFLIKETCCTRGLSRQVFGAR